MISLSLKRIVDNDMVLLVAERCLPEVCCVAFRYSEAVVTHKLTLLEKVLQFPKIFEK